MCYSSKSSEIWFCSAGFVFVCLFLNEMPCIFLFLIWNNSKIYLNFNCSILPLSNNNEKIRSIGRGLSFDSSSLELVPEWVRSPSGPPGTRCKLGVKNLIGAASPSAPLPPPLPAAPLRRALCRPPRQERGSGSGAMRGAMGLA